VENKLLTTKNHCTLSLII